ncbi:MAG TPA: hypothetical protein VFX96_01875 [Pyrinomonadaceae bacterium]|nr:hypothetical protein [Pyrinomonadaceae bacterium]
MHTPLKDELEEELSGLFSTCAPTAETAATGRSLEELPTSLAAVVRGIEPPEVREFMRGIFVHIVQLLGRVESVRDALEGGGPSDGLARAFDALRKSSHYLLTNVETAELRVDGLSDALIETFEATGFALRHELKRVFKTELAGAPVAQSEAERSLLRACALLENCYQQLTVTLARSFDAGVSGAALFENYRRRREQTLVLREELRGLLDNAREIVDEYSVLPGLSLLLRVRRFRYECLHYLMYRDWDDFERFADALELSYESGEEMAVLVHKLSCYVETLLSQVEMRAVLTDD